MLSDSTPTPMVAVVLPPSASISRTMSPDASLLTKTSDQHPPDPARQIASSPELEWHDARHALHADSHTRDHTQQLCVAGGVMRKQRMAHATTSNAEALLGSGVHPAKSAAVLGRALRAFVVCLRFRYAKS